MQGWDGCIGCSAWVAKPAEKDSALIPHRMFLAEPYSPGRSTGGEAALLAYGGSRIGIETDAAGSVSLLIILE